MVLCAYLPPKVLGEKCSFPNGSSGEIKVKNRPQSPDLRTAICVFTVLEPVLLSSLACSTTSCFLKSFLSIGRVELAELAGKFLSSL